MSAGKTSGSGTLSSIAGFFGLSALGGILAAALVIPAVALTGVAASSAVNVFDSLPSSLEPGELSEPSRIYGADSAGNYFEMAQFYIDNRRTVDWDGLSDTVKDAAVAAEDRRFYDHNGVDLFGVVRAAINNFSGGATEGSSTITMQYVRNTLVLQAMAEGNDEGVLAALDVTLERKIEEIKYAVALEKTHTKDQILLGYLNSINFGNVYGIEAAAQKYYSKSAIDLSISEAASLIAIVQLPESFRLDRPDSETNGAANGYAANKVRRDDIINRMLTEKMITQEEADEALATEITPVLSTVASGCQYATAAPFFCDYVLSQLRSSDLYDSVFAGSDQDRYTQLARGGYDIYTTINLDLQATAQLNVETWAPQGFEGMDLGGATTSVEVGTGRILAMAQNRSYDATADISSRTSTALNYNTDTANGGSAGFATGSTFKVFTLATWLEQGHALNDMVSGARENYQISSFPDRCLGRGGGVWNPRNAGASPSSTTVQNATNASINTAFLNMARQMDLCDVREMANRLGAYRADGNDFHGGPSMVIGSDEVAPLQMAVSYATIANGGRYCAPVAIDRIVDRDGVELALPANDCSQAIEENVANTMVYGLKQVLTQGTGTGSNPNNGLNVFGKTGTHDNSEQTWMVASTPNVSTAVWVGNVTGKVGTGRFSVGGVNLSTVRHRIMRDILTRVSQIWGPGQDWAAPDNSLIAGRSVEIPDLSGQTVEAATELLTNLGFQVGDGGETTSALAAGLVVGSTPGAGESVTAGSTINLVRSNGNGYTVPEVSGLTEAAAKSAFSTAGHIGGFGSSTTQYSATVPSGQVIQAEGLSTGSVADKTGSVRFVISDGPDPDDDDD